MGEEASGGRVFSVSFLMLVIGFAAALGLTLVVYSTSLNPGLPIVLGGGLAVFWGGWRAVRGSARYYHPGSELAIGLLAWAALSTPFADDVYLARKSLATLTGAVPFLLACQCGLERAKQWRAHAFILLAISSAACFYAWFDSWSEAVDTGSFPPLSSSFNNPDVFAVLPMLSLCLGLGLWERSEGKSNYPLFCLLGFFGLTIFATGCRAAMLGVAVGSLSFVLSLASHRPSRLKRTRQLLVIPFALVLLLLPLSNFGFSVEKKLTRSLADTAALETTRYEVFRLGPSATLRNPLLGAGPGCFGRSFQSVRQEGHDQLYINVAHNDYVEMAVELGLPGFLLWVGLCVLAVRYPYGLVEGTRRPMQAGAALAAVVAGLVFQCFNFIVSERPVFWALFWVMGLAFSFPSSRKSFAEHPGARVVGAGLLIALGAWSISFGYRTLRADEYIVRAQRFRRALQMERAVQNLDRAIGFLPESAKLRRERAKFTVMLSEYQQTEEVLEEASAHLTAARQSSPRDVLVMLDLAGIQVRQKRYDDARSTLEAAREVAPYHHLVLRKLTALAVRQGRFVDAARLVARDEVRTGSSRVAVLAPLLHSIELKEPGKGVELLKAWLDSAQPAETWPRETLEKVILATARAKQWEVAISFAELKLTDEHTALCAKVFIAKCTGRLKGPAAEWKLLSQALGEVEPRQTQCYGELLKAWSEAGLDGHVREVEERLWQILDSDQRQLEARLQLVGLLAGRNRYAEAIKVARRGLETDERSSELIRLLAELYEQSGSRELAISYYRDLRKLAPKDASVEAKLKSLLKTP